MPTFLGYFNFQVINPLPKRLTKRPKPKGRKRR